MTYHTIDCEFVSIRDFVSTTSRSKLVSLLTSSRIPGTFRLPIHPRSTDAQASSTSISIHGCPFLGSHPILGIERVRYIALVRQVPQMMVRQPLHKCRMTPDRMWL
jgi:hypothetical protein